MENNGKKFSTHFNNFHILLIINILYLNINNECYIIDFQLNIAIIWIKMDNNASYPELHWKQMETFGAR